MFIIAKSEHFYKLRLKGISSVPKQSKLDFYKTPSILFA